MKMPNSSKKMLTKIRNIHGDRFMLMMKSASSCGSPSMVKIQANADDKPMMISTEAVSKAERAKMSGSAFHSSVRYKYLPQISA